MKFSHFARLGALVTLAALIGGCGGGGSGPSTTSATPLPAPTFIEPPAGPGNTTVITSPESTLVLPGGELAIFNLKSTGRSAEGTLRVLSGVTSPTSLAPGTYPLVGVFSAPTAFSVASQNLGGQDFTISGNIADASNPRGIYTIRRGKVINAAQVLINNDSFTRASTPYNPSGDLTFSNVRSFGPTDLSPNASIEFAPVTRNGPGAFGFVDTTTFGAFFHFQTAGEPTNLAFDVTGTRRNPTNPRQYLNLAIRSGYKTPFTIGQVIDLTNPNAIPTQGNIVVAQFTPGGTPYVSTQGTIIVRDFGAETLSLELRNVNLVTKSGSPAASQPTGAVTLNGIFDAEGMSNGLRGDGRAGIVASNLRLRRTSPGTPEAPEPPR